MKQPKLLAAIANVSMALGHDGLSIVAKKFNIKVEKLEDGELVLFINKQRDRLKMIGAKGVVLGYVRMPKGQSLPVGAIQYLPQAFSGDGKINVDSAIATYVEKTMQARCAPGDGVSIQRGRS